MAGSLSRAFLPEELVGLSERQITVYDRLIAGEAEKSIAEAMGLSPHTVHSHVKAVYKTAKVNSQRELAAMLITRLGMLLGRLNRHEIELPQEPERMAGDYVPLDQRLVINASGEVRNYGQKAEQDQGSVV